MAKGMRIAFKRQVADPAAFLFTPNASSLIHGAGGPPTFGTAPTLVGTPTVGIACAYTPGTVSGALPITTTQHWQLDGADIVDSPAGFSTSATYVPVSGDAGHQLRPREIATNALGSASSTGASATVVSVSAPMTLAFDAQTPEQISIRAPLTRAVASGTTVDAEYKLTSSGTWLAGGRLFQITVSALPSGAPSGIVDAFAGCIFGLTAGSNYDIRLTVIEPGFGTATTTGTQSTRALPATAPAANKSATPATLAAQLLTLAPGDCLQLADGTYAAITLALGNSGSSGSPIYIRGTTRAGTIISNASQCVEWAASHVVLENMTLLGSQVDAGNTPASAGIHFATGLATPQTNATIRNITATGFDRFCKAYEPVNGRLVYNCTITGNNTWDKTYAVDPSSGGFSLTWNDDGVSGPGLGNCFFDSTITGHGDALKLTSSVNTGNPLRFFSAANFMYRIACARTGDDFAEVDDSTGNIGIYDCEVKNAGTNFSVDNVYGGPFYFFRNRCANTTRGPVKPTSNSQNVYIANNTFVRTTSQTTYGLYAANGGANSDWRVKNNLIVYRGASDVIRWDCSLPNLDWDYNAIYPSAGANISLGSGRGTQSSLAAAKTTLAPLMAHDVAATTNPFALTITLGSNYTTEYTGPMVFTLAGGVTSLNAGVALPNITDGYTGAAPDIGAVIAGRTTATAGDTSTLPAWVTSAASGTWVQIPGTTLSSVDPDPSRVSAYAGSSGLSSAVDAWNGAAFDATNGVMWLTALGGHSNYFGNGVFKWSLNAAAPAWTMVLSPSVVADYTTAAGTASTYSDGRPRSTHSYDACVYIPTVGPALAGLPGRTHDGGLGSRAIIRFNESTGAATFGADPVASGSSTGVASCFDSTRGTSGSVWRRQAGTSTMQRYDVAADAWTNVGSSQAYASTMSMTYIPGLDVILLGNGDDLGGSQSFQWAVFDCASGNYFTPTFTGAPSVGVAHPGGLFPGLCQPAWVSSLGAALAWDNSTSTTQILKITPPASSPTTNAWTLSYMPVSGGVTPSAAQANGTYGRVAWWPDAGMLVLLNAYNQQGFAYKV